MTKTTNKTIDYALLIDECMKYDVKWHGKDLYITTNEKIELEDGQEINDEIVYKNLSKKDLKAKIKYLLEKIK